MTETTTLTEVAIVGAVAAIGGFLGGYLASRRSTIVGSILIGIIGGMVTAVLISATEFPPVLEVGDYSVLWAFLGGGVVSAIVGASSS
jgi:fructose-specific phosphotransferase system IIC component